MGQTRIATRPPQTKEEIDAWVQCQLGKHSFWEFCLWMDASFFVKREFLRPITAALQEVYDQYMQGKAIKITLSLPPRAGKSYVVSLFCAWWLGKLPELAVMRNTCTASLYRKFSYDVRAIVDCDRFAACFPDIALSPDNSSVDGWNLTTSKQKAYFGGGVGTKIIGFGANLAITDDLYGSMEDGLSDNYNERVDSWKQSAHNSRMEANCPEIYIGTRWSMRDQIGQAIERGRVAVEIKVPALTAEGKSFCEAVKTTEEYIQIKADTEESIWDAEYMQDPAEIKGQLFPKSQLSFFDPTEITEDWEYVLQVVDPADEGGDSLSAPIVKFKGGYGYVTGWIHNNYGTDVNIPAVVDSAKVNKANFCQVEGNSGWVLAGKDIRNQMAEASPDTDVRIIKAITNKETRILASSAWIKNHLRFRSDYEEISEYRAAMRELMKYMREGDNKHDDAPDALNQVAEYAIKNNL